MSLMATIHRITTDESLQLQLRSLQEVTVVCDAAGNRLGHFLPVTIPVEVLSGLRQCPYSEAELDAFDKETGGRTLSEILKSLERSA